LSNKTGLPERYETYWGQDFWAFVHGALVDGGSVLDVGAGRQPTIAPADRPPRIHYVGMDIEASELKLAAPGSYDETVAADAEVVRPELVNRFDLALSWQVLEHVRHLDRAAAAFDEYLRPGGWYVAMLSGRNVS
jgi:2-polyprenyl-3-methyl-5-hydroxy-6-metoxy-1,4-benzoquinol methylase